jgi:hypothetical protein
MILHCITADDYLPIPNEVRIRQFRTEYAKRTDRMEHDARIAGGVAFLDDFRKRPIPKHRALTVPPQPFPRD